MVQGTNAFQHYMTVIVPAEVERQVRAALEVAAQKLVDDLKQRAPVYSGPETTRSDGSAIIKGALRDSIGWTWGDAPRGALTLGGAKAKLGGRDAIKITIYAGGGDAFYARWVEFGTLNWQGSPFFFGTYRDHKRRIKGGITRALRKAIKNLV